MKLTEKQKNCPYCHVQHRSDVLPDYGWAIDESYPEDGQVLIVLRV